MDRLFGRGPSRVREVLVSAVADGRDFTMMRTVKIPAISVLDIKNLNDPIPLASRKSRIVFGYDKSSHLAKVRHFIEYKPGLEKCEKEVSVEEFQGLHNKDKSVALKIPKEWVVVYRDWDQDDRVTSVWKFSTIAADIDGKIEDEQFDIDFSMAERVIDGDKRKTIAK